VTEKRAVSQGLEDLLIEVPLEVHEKVTLETDETQGDCKVAETEIHRTRPQEGVHERNLYLACLVLIERRRLQKVRLELERSLGQLARLSARVKLAGPGPILFQDFLQKLPWAGPDITARGADVRMTAGADDHETAEDSFTVVCHSMEDDGGGGEVCPAGSQTLEVPRMQIPKQRRPQEVQHPWQTAQRQHVKPKPKQRSRPDQGTSLPLHEQSQVLASENGCSTISSPLAPSLQPASVLQPVGTNTLSTRANSSFREG